MFVQGLATLALALSASAFALPFRRQATSTTDVSSSTTDVPTTTVPTSTPVPTTSVAPSTTSTSSSVAPTSTLPAYLVGTQTGDGTYYAPGLGACGISNTNADMIAAVSHLLYDTFPGYTGTNPNNNPICGHTVTASYGGSNVTVAITDRCTACAITDLDFAPAAFDKLASETVGRIHGVTWVWDDLPADL
ncbi:plant expansin [Coniophora puteana RWD-64-598 SS2]|uniref:Plant expansin n=1 Tax=Coniophora puteana (strain RWD-64-598) TaxID=741705 RepID=R7SDU6_CONPW|nr:plant expansin [Coniophora puteana RWD-64-598 SS2]EIW74045.1 plant expansin [Coniophora puteana RWD-64-598 SS2]